MLISVFGDLLYFIMIFAVIIGGFTVLLEVILQSKANADEALVSKNTLLKKGFHEEEEAYSSYNGIQTIAFYVLAMRQSIGD
jgi:sensor domain CHASE-containing protein